MQENLKDRIQEQQEYIDKVNKINLGKNLKYIVLTM